MANRTKSPERLPNETAFEYAIRCASEGMDPNTYGEKEAVILTQPRYYGIFAIVMAATHEDLERKYGLTEDQLMQLARYICQRFGWALFSDVKVVLKPEEDE